MVLYCGGYFVVVMFAGLVLDLYCCVWFGVGRLVWLVLCWFIVFVLLVGGGLLDCQCLLL